VDPDYFDAAYFATDSARVGAAASSAASPYFDCTYFAQTYFDTSDCASPAVGGGGRGGRVRRLPSPPMNDDEELFALI
jgi:hypothetical protein